MYRTKSQLIGNVSTGASFAGIITASGLSADTVNISGVTTIANITFSSGIITSTSGVVTFYGDGSGLTGISAGSTVFDDTSTDATFYPVFTDTTSGLLSTSRVSTTNLTFNPSSSTLQVGTGITLSGSDGSISIAGTIFASSLNIPIEVSSFDPVNGSAAANNVNIILTFNQTVGFGTTGFIEIKAGSATTGSSIERVGIGSTRVTLSNGGTRLTIDPTSSLPLNTIFPVMSSGFVVANGSNFVGINTVGSGVTYSFTASPALGDAFGGGRLICQSGGIRWISALCTAILQRSWYCRADANTRAQQVSGCTGWFIPNGSQLQNPAFICRDYMDFWNFLPSNTPIYWSNDVNPVSPTSNAMTVRFDPGGGGNDPAGALKGRNMASSYYARSIRCVSY